DGGQAVALGGQTLPAQTGMTSPGSMRILCIAPGEWLIVSDDYTASSLRARLESDLPKHGLALVDVTDALASLEIRGSAARDVIAKGCGIDFHPRSLPTGRCVRTRFAQIAVVIDCIDDSPRFELSVARSYLDYLHSWLTDATAEFGG